MGGLGEVSIVRQTTVLGISEEARAKTKLSWAVGRVKGGLLNSRAGCQLCPGTAKFHILSHHSTAPMAHAPFPSKRFNTKTPPVFNLPCSHRVIPTPQWHRAPGELSKVLPCSLLGLALRPQLPSRL